MPPGLLSRLASRATRNHQVSSIRIGALRLGPAWQRNISEDQRPLPKSDKPGPGPNQQQLPHVSEEAATMGNITGEEGPELEKGTPVQEVWLFSCCLSIIVTSLLPNQILQRDSKAKEKAPEVLKPAAGSNSPKGSRSYSTTSRRQNQQAVIPVAGQALEGEGHKFGLPTLPLPARAHIRYREDPVVQQVTQLLIKDGKKSVAQRVGLTRCGVLHGSEFSRIWQEY